MRILALSSSVTLIVVALATGGCQSTPSAQTESPPPARSLPGPVTAASAGVTLQGQITALDKSSRAVTVTGADGSSLSFVAGPDVRNFNQLKVGDNVTLDYRAAVALDLQPAGSGEVGVTTSQAGTVPVRGATPGGARSNTVNIVTEVVAVDPVANTIALRGPSGNTQLIAVEREDLRAKLPSVKRGDLLRISYTEAVALGIRRDSP
ncbi:hypothetical protein [Stenotrophomonas sp. AB1(2024)]|uniref:hypothetical protein n=1 Tax=Stenotrophomonas sp. AB1(2024) TaxID=3132215 RepID=UPI00309821DC